MRHQIATRIVLLIAAVLVAASVTFALVQS